MSYPFRNELAEFVFYRTYARWIEDQGRRETWEETISRYIKYVVDPHKDKIPTKAYNKVTSQIKKMGVMPSMRAVWSSGGALGKNNIAGYNCCYLPIIDIFSFSELLFILMHGTGVGFSVEQENIDQMPIVQPQTSAGAGVHVVDDSKEGWAESVRIGFEAWFNGKDIEFDYTKIRPRGARLKTMGGRASGPDPLIKLHKFAKEIILNAANRRLTSLEVHDIVCKIAEIVVVGGVRRSSLISFSDLNDELLMTAKDQNVISANKHRYMSNNSAVFPSKPDSVTFMREWYNLAQSGSGERGIYNISNMAKYAPRRKFTGKERSNPCGEILLRPREFCNLSEVVIRASDSFSDIVEKVTSATWLGAIQSTMTDFSYIRDEFKKNCEEERLLGVSLTGQLDNVKMMTEEKLEILRDHAIKTAKKASKALGINTSVSITTGKPSGTVSQLVDAASGCHPRYARYYLRRVRISDTDPLYRMMKAQGVPFEPEVGQDPKNPDTWVVSFPVKAPKNSITRDQVTAIEQLEHYLKIQENWCEHNQSCFTGEEKFLTDKGLKSFNEFKNGEKVNVVNKNGEFSPATVKSFGKQPIMEVVLQKGQYLTKTIRTTENHLWPVTYNAQRHFGYKEKTFTTKDLPIGKQFVSTFQKVETGMNLEGLLHGIVFGDGTYHKKGHYKTRNCSIALCGDSRHLKKYFIQAGYKIKERDDINQTRIYGLPDYWKKIPDTTNASYVYSFISGWFAADGSVSKTAGNISLSSVNKTALEWVLNVSSVCGLAVQPTLTVRSNKNSTYGGEDVYKLSFIKESLESTFFVHKMKKSRFEDRSSQSSKHWKIVDVRYTGDVEEVFCVEEPKTNHFVLEGNILTHNCTIYVKEDEWAEVGAYVYRNFDRIVGVSFLPYDGGMYDLAPYQEITEKEYEEAKKNLPKIDYTELTKFEQEDQTTGSQALACSSGVCEII